MAETCKGCGQPIRWARTTKGRRIPLDPEPTPNGNLAFDQTEEEGASFVRVVPVGARPRLYTSHFATCPAAASFRRSKKTGGTT